MSPYPLKKEEEKERDSLDLSDQKALS